MTQRVHARRTVCWRLALASVFGVLAPTTLLGQGQIGANPKDVETIDGIVGALYETISGPAGERRDWDRFRSLFIEEARLIPTGFRPDGSALLEVNTVDEYIQTSGAMLEDRGFFEQEIFRAVEHYGPVVHAFSTYESRWQPDDAEPFSRGINSVQLLHDGDRWSIVNIYWHNETANTPIPAKYLPPRGR
jgi:hypothetical protein